MVRFGQQLIAVIVAVAAASLTACGGGGVRGAASVPVVASSAAPGKSASATLRITIPFKTTTSAGNRRAPRYISPATRSLAISFVPATGPPLTFNQNLTTASNPNCQASLISPTICTLTFALQVGSYTAAFTTYDGLLDVAANPTGNKLSANQNFPFTIAQGQANAINVTLQGIPTTLAVLPSASSALRGSTPSGFTLSSCAAGSHGLTVLGVDADGNYILGSGAPVPSLTAPDATVVSIAAAPASNPNAFAFTTRPGVAAGASVRLTAAVTPSTAAPTDSGSYAVSVPIQLTYDATLCGTITAFSVPTANANLSQITAGPDGALWFTETNGDKIGRITTAGSVTEYPLTTSSGPWGITAGPDGALWFTEQGTDKIGRITTAGAVTEYPIPSAGAGLEGITAGRDGARWFAEGGTHKIGRITTAGAVTEYLITSGNVGPAEITAGPDGALWFTEYIGPNIGRITTAGVITEYRIPTASSFPFGIAAGADGALWFAEQTGNKIGRITTAGIISEYTLPAANSNPFEITAGPDGALWFIEYPSKIGRITTAGTITEFPLTTPQQYGIGVGPDGALWFTNYTAIGRLQ
jgi:virginiamycin B lyase